MQVEEPSISSIRNRIMTEKDEKYRLAFMYAFLTGCEITEACGPYSPRGTDAVEVSYLIDDVFQPAVLFKIKSARRNGSIRSCVLPLDPKYEPWVELILRWFKKCGNDYVFNFSQTGTLESSKRYAGLRIKELFKGFKTIKEGYRRDKGRKIETCHAPFLFTALRQIRKQQLENDYNFDEIDLAKFGGWRIKSTNAMVNLKVKDIFENKREFNLEEYKKDSEMYFKKLLINYEDAIKAKDEDAINYYNKYQNILKRINQTKNIRELLNTIKGAFDWKLHAQFFNNDNIEFIFSILDECENEKIFTNKIEGLATLLEVPKEPFIKRIKNPPNNIYDLGTIDLLNICFKEKEIIYNQEMFDIWKKIKILRNYYPTHANPKDNNYKKLVLYFGISDPGIIDYQTLWDNVLEKFILSLNYLKIALKWITED